MIMRMGGSQREEIEHHTSACSVLGKTILQDSRFEIYKPRKSAEMAEDKA
jgi:hypothetical protein